jgi:galactose mutarotase-like enzyme
MVEASLASTNWHGFRALVMENETVRLVVVPETGARIVSLYDKLARYEWLVSPEQAHAFRALPSGTPFNENHSGGWDEMLPTIVACVYPGPGARQGLALPDHGEIWTLPWSDAGCDAAGIRLSVTGATLPYRLTRSLALNGEGELSLEYQLVNLGDEPLLYLWAAHPQFACQPGARIELPPTETEVVNVLPGSWGPEFGTPGTYNTWPAIPQPSGATLHQDLIAGPETGRGRKFYLPPERPIQWAAIHQPTAGCALRLAWDAARLPYCGVWVDEGCLNQVATAAIEPTNAYYDDLGLAAHNGRVGEIAAGISTSWRLTVRLACENNGAAGPYREG